MRRVRALRWTGSARIFVGEDQIDIGLSTRVEPFVRSRSDTWLISDGPGKPRSLIIEPDGGWTEWEGVRTAMDRHLLVHERAQYALYGLMLLAPLREPGASAPDGPQPGTFIARHRNAPETLFGLTRNGRLAWATNRVPAPDSEAGVAQRFEFSGTVRSGAIRWPQQLRISQEGQPYFALSLDTFVAEMD